MILLISIKNSILFLFIKIGDADINDRPKIAFQEKPCSEEYGFFLDNLLCLCYNTNKCLCFGERDGEKQLRNERRKGKEGEKAQQAYSR